MRLKLVLILVIHVVADVRNDFLLDYFRYKKAPRIVGFSCNRSKEDFALMKKFTEVGITSIFAKPVDDSLTYQLIYADYHKIGIYVDARCKNLGDISMVFSQATNGRLYDELHYWIVIATNLGKAIALLNDEAFCLATDLVIAIPTVYEDRRQGFTLYDVYNPHKPRGGKLNVTFLGSWHSQLGLRINLTQEKYGRRSDLHGMYWKISFFGSKYRPKNVSLEDHMQDLERTGKKDGPSKFGYNLMKHLSEMHNVSLILGEYAKWNTADRMGPMTKALQYGEIDFSGTPISIFRDKIDIIKIVYTCWPFRTCFLFRSPEVQDIKVHEVLRPLATRVWYISGVMFIIFVVILSVNMRYENVESTFMRYSNSFLLTVGCHCQQGTTMQLERLSTKISYLIVMIFSLLIYNYYSASVVSARLNEPIIKINDSLDSLAMTNLRVASESMLYFDFLMQESGKNAELFMRKKWSKVPDTDRFMLPESGMLLVKKGGFAYHVHPDVGYPYINRLYDNREICELTEVHLAKPSHRSIAVTYNSSFVEISRVGFMKITEVGLRNRHLIRWKSRKPICRNDMLSASSMTIYEFAPHLILLCVGQILAIVLLFAELFIAHIKKNKKRQPATITKRRCWETDSIGSAILKKSSEYTILFFSATVKKFKLIYRIVCRTKRWKFITRRKSKASKK